MLWQADGKKNSFYVLYLDGILQSVMFVEDLSYFLLEYRKSGLWDLKAMASRLAYLFLLERFSISGR